ncbi:phage major tail protein, TP901-1 family [Cytobacillus purgationiresistens]|uniref:TP901-1 family phage major tail protein n=1 Tax=Cytobacillus purgationiresistens TaxID=863449 RepID=A0ABU0ADP8_9BACI|nr:phage major tail protein, TP901-1 family [Cytobacillus purgationiresistens]MDQ0269014.1 TP901-1 family phage major tail protein [Cytobacillus purgationiresistens]
MAKMQGMKCFVKIMDLSDPNSPKVLAGQRNATLNRSAETLDATSKDTEGYWKENLQGFKEWSVDCDGVLVGSDSALAILEDQFLNSENVDVVIELASGTTYQGNAVITDFPIDMPYDDLVTYSLSLTGSGALAKNTTSSV